MALNKPDDIKDVLKSRAEYIKRMSKLTVLILGPGPEGGEYYEKRCEIKNRIIELGHDAHFAEDICNRELLISCGLNLSIAEYIVARETCDYVICLETSAGSLGEFHEFARKREIAAKMLACLDSNHKAGYTAQGALRIFEGYHGKVDWFVYPSDIKDCHLLARVEEQIRKVAEGKQKEIISGGMTS